MEIKRFDNGPGCSRMVIHNGVAYFTGHSARPEFKTMKEQTAAVLARYDELFAEFSLKKENIIMLNGYLADMNMMNDFNEVFCAWMSADNSTCAPAGVCVQAKPSGDGNLLELQFIVAVD
ncbi:MAG: Rid family hydrolase [Oscillospiraceae bacterium]